MKCVAELVVLLDRVVVLGSHGEQSLRCPPGVHPVLVEEHEGKVGRLTVVFDVPTYEQALAEGRFEQLWPVQGPLVITGDVGAHLLEEGAGPKLEPQQALGTHLLDPGTGANALTLDANGELAWWYRGEEGDEAREDEGVCALDLIFSSACHPLAVDAPQRNLPQLVAKFLSDHGPPSFH